MSSSTARRIRELRKKLGMNQERFAEAVGVSQSAISKWENALGRPDLKVALRMEQLGGLNAANYALSDDERYGFTMPEYEASPENYRQVIRVVGGIDSNNPVSSPYWPVERHYDLNLPVLPQWEELDLVGFLVQDSEMRGGFTRNSVIVVARFKEDLIYPDRFDDIVFVTKDDESDLCFVQVKRTVPDEVTGALNIHPYLFPTEGDPNPVLRIEREDLARKGYEGCGLIGIIVGGFLVRYISVNSKRNKNA